MIQVINFPQENRYLLDGNNTVITVTSDNADGYFRAKIYIDDALFDEQGWSRKDDFTATKDLLYLYNAYFKPYFLGTFTTGLLEQTNFKKKVSIVIEELDIDTDVLLGTVTLPDFYLLYNVKSAIFNDINKLFVFGLNAPRMNMKKDGTIVIPFYVNAEDEDVKVTIKDDIGNTLHTQTISGVTGKKVYIYTLNLSEVTVISAALFLRATIEVGTTTTEKIYKVLRLPNYEVKEVVFQNNFGYYIPAYFDGDFENTSGYKVQSYERYDTSTAVYAVEEDGTYVINTGGLSILEKDIVKEIANSIECFFRNGTEYKRVNTATKKSTNSKSRLNIYSEDLTFTFSAGLPFSNLNVDGYATEDPEAPIVLELVATDLEFLGSFGGIDPIPRTHEFSISFTTTFSIFQLFYQTRLNSSFAWSFPSLFEGVTSPQEYQIEKADEFHDVRIFAYYNGQIIYSNVLTYTE
jgi:hypothetical protein